MKVRTKEKLQRAYSHINANNHELVAQIKPNHVEEYEWLIQNHKRAGDYDYQHRYKSYWGMHRIGFSSEYYREYFRYLLDERCFDIQVKELAYTLYETPVRNDVQMVQFCFCSKLCHMNNHKLPIYDSNVYKFYGFNPPTTGLPSDRIDKMDAFYQFLIEEYKSILDEKTLGPSIHAFRNRFDADCFTDIKVIDSLIWAYQGMFK